MASRSGVDSVEESEVFLLLKEYCSKRSQQRSQRSQQRSQRSQQRSKQLIFMPCSPYILNFQGPAGDESRDVNFRSIQKDGSRSAVAGRLVQIAESAPIPEVKVEDQDEIIQKLVELVKTSGDDINKKIKQNEFLQQQLRMLNYDMFERLTSSVQSLVGQEVAAGASDRRIQQQKIAWAFEVTSRLSAVDVVHRRRVLSFADRYIQQHHDAWLQQHGGWEEVFDLENVD